MPEWARSFKMETKTVTTKAGSQEYTLTIQQFSGPDELFAKYAKEGDTDFVSVPRSAAETVTRIVNAAQEQGGKQGGKDAVRKAVATGEQAKIDEAIATHQKGAAGYVIGAPRGGRTSGPISKKKAADFGTAYAEKMKSKGAPLSQQEQKDLMAEYGLDKL
jgi:hypothetical protein